MAFYQKMVEIELVKTNEGLKSRMAKVIIFLLNLRRLSFGKIAIIILSITHLHFSHTHSPSLVLSFSFSLSLTCSNFLSLSPSLIFSHFFLSLLPFFYTFIPFLYLFIFLSLLFSVSSNQSLFLQTSFVASNMLGTFFLSVINDF